MGRIVNSFEREFGKNAGKVVSNFLFGDSHSTPYRRVGSSNRAPKEQVVTVYHEPSEPSIKDIRKMELDDKTLDEISNLADLPIPKDSSSLYNLLSKLTSLMAAHKWSTADKVGNKYNEVLLQKGKYCLLALKSLGIQSAQLDYYDSFIQKYTRKGTLAKHFYWVALLVIVTIAGCVCLFVYLDAKRILIPTLEGVGAIVVCVLSLFIYRKISRKSISSQSSIAVYNANSQKDIGDTPELKENSREDTETKFIDLKVGGRIENKLREIWLRYKRVPKTIIERHPIFSADGVKNSLLFIGVNPSYNPEDDINLLKSQNGASLMYGSFYNLESAPNYFKILEAFATACGKAYSHINLLYARENNRDILLSCDSNFI